MGKCRKIQKTFSWLVFPSLYYLILLSISIFPNKLYAQSAEYIAAQAIANSKSAGMSFVEEQNEFGEYFLRQIITERADDGDRDADKWTRQEGPDVAGRWRPDSFVMHGLQGFGDSRFGYLNDSGGNKKMWLLEADTGGSEGAKEYSRFEGDVYPIKDDAHDNGRCNEYCQYLDKEYLGQYGATGVSGTNYTGNIGYSGRICLANPMKCYNSDSVCTEKNDGCPGGAKTRWGTQHFVYRCVDVPRCVPHISVPDERYPADDQGWQPDTCPVCHTPTLETHKLDDHPQWQGSTPEDLRVQGCVIMDSGIWRGYIDGNYTEQDCSVLIEPTKGGEGGLPVDKGDDWRGACGSGMFREDNDTDIWPSRTGCYNPEERFAYVPGTRAYIPQIQLKNHLFSKKSYHDTVFAEVTVAQPFQKLRGTNEVILEDATFDKNIIDGAADVDIGGQPRDDILGLHPLCVVKDKIKTLELSTKGDSRVNKIQCLYSDYQDDLDDFCGEYIKHICLGTERYQTLRWVWSSESSCWEYLTTPAVRAPNGLCETLQHGKPTIPSEYEHWMPLAVSTPSDLRAKFSNSGQEEELKVLEYHFGNQTGAPLTGSHYAGLYGDLGAYGYRDEKITKGQQIFKDANTSLPFSFPWNFNPYNIYNDSELAGFETLAQAEKDTALKKIFDPNNMGLKAKKQQCLKIYLEEYAHLGDCGQVVLKDAPSHVDTGHCQWVAMHPEKKYPKKIRGLRSEHWDYESFISAGWVPNQNQYDVCEKSLVLGDGTVSGLPSFFANKGTVYVAKDLGAGKAYEEKEMSELEGGGLDFSKRGCPTFAPQNLWPVEFQKECDLNVGAIRLGNLFSDTFQSFQNLVKGSLNAAASEQQGHIPAGVPSFLDGVSPLTTNPVDIRSMILIRPPVIPYVRLTIPPKFELKPESGGNFNAGAALINMLPASGWWMMTGGLPVSLFPVWNPQLLGAMKAGGGTSDTDYGENGQATAPPIPPSSSSSSSSTGGGAPTVVSVAGGALEVKLSGFPIWLLQYFDGGETDEQILDRRKSLTGFPIGQRDWVDYSWPAKDCVHDVATDVLGISPDFPILNVFNQITGGLGDRDTYVQDNLASRTTDYINDGMDPAEAEAKATEDLEAEHAENQNQNDINNCDVDTTDNSVPPKTTHVGTETLEYTQTFTCAVGGVVYPNNANSCDDLRPEDDVTPETPKDIQCNASKCSTCFQYEDILYCIKPDGTKLNITENPSRMALCDPTSSGGPDILQTITSKEYGVCQQRAAGASGCGKKNQLDYKLFGFPFKVTADGTVENIYKFIPNVLQIGAALTSGKPNIQWCNFQVPFDPYHIGKDDYLHNELPYGPGVSAHLNINRKPQPREDGDPQYDLRLEFQKVERIRNGCGAFAQRATWIDDPNITLSKFMTEEDASKLEVKGRCQGWTGYLGKQYDNPKIVSWRLPRFDYEFLKAFIECTGPYRSASEADLVCDTSGVPGVQTVMAPLGFDYIAPDAYTAIKNIVDGVGSKVNRFTGKIPSWLGGGIVRYCTGTGGGSADGTPGGGSEAITDEAGSVIVAPTVPGVDTGEEGEKEPDSSLTRLYKCKCYIENAVRAASALFRIAKAWKERPEDCKSKGEDTDTEPANPPPDTASDDAKGADMVRFLSCYGGMVGDGTTMIQSLIAGWQCKKISNEAALKNLNADSPDSYNAACLGINATIAVAKGLCFVPAVKSALTAVQADFCPDPAKLALQIANLTVAGDDCTAPDPNQQQIKGDKPIGFWCSCPEDVLLTTQCREDYCTCQQEVIIGGNILIKPVSTCVDYGPFRRWLQCYYYARAAACPIITRDISSGISPSKSLLTY